MIALVVCAILIWVGLEDMRHFRVRNLAVVALCLCFPIDCIAHGRSALLAPHLLLAALSFVVLAGAFFLGAIGGGDAKLLTAAVLWIGPRGSVVFALALLAGTGLYALGALLGWLPRKRWRGRTAIPFGPSIAAAWIATIGLQVSGSI